MLCGQLRVNNQSKVTNFLVNCLGARDESSQPVGHRPLVAKMELSLSRSVRRGQLYVGGSFSRVCKRPVLACGAHQLRLFDDGKYSSLGCGRVEP